MVTSTKLVGDKVLMTLCAMCRWTNVTVLRSTLYPMFHDHVFGCVASVVRSNVQMVAGSTGLRGGDSGLHCTVLPVVPLAGGRGSGYVARPPRKRQKRARNPAQRRGARW